MAVAAISLTGFARDKVSHDVAVLPQAAQNMVKKHFAKTGVNHIKIDKGIVGAGYEVILNDGTELDFDSNGNLTEIDTRTGVPSELLMKSIREYVSDNYPGQKVINLDIVRSGYDVELANGTELVFDRAGTFKRIDY